jgi:hypothetical protein
MHKPLTGSIKKCTLSLSNKSKRLIEKFLADMACQQIRRHTKIPIKANHAKAYGNWLENLTAVYKNYAGFKIIP